jgi:predicted dehydrogenase
LTLRGALLGAGNIAQLGHLPAYAEVSERGTRCRIVAVADLCEENLDRATALVPGAKTYRDAERLLDEMHPDFVDICAPPYAHRQLVELATEHGCHILCEKPLSMNLADAMAIADSLRDRALVFMPGHQYHHAPAWLAISEAAERGEIGVLHSGIVSIERQAANSGNTFWNPRWRTTEALSGGGILMDHGIHLFYQLGSLFGRPRRLSAHVELRRHLSYEVEDTAWCELEFADAVARIELTWASDRRRSVHIYRGAEGDIACDESSLLINGRSGRRRIALNGGFSQDSSHSAWYVPLLNDFLSRIERGDFDRAPLEEALLSMRCALAAYQSARTGQFVDLA